MNKEVAVKFKLSLSYNLWELIYSYEALESGLLNDQLKIPEKYILNLKRLCENIIEPVRNNVCKPEIRVGYTCRKLSGLLHYKQFDDDYFIKGKGCVLFFTDKEKLKDAYNYIKNNCKFELIHMNIDNNTIEVIYDEFSNKKQEWQQEV